MGGSVALHYWTQWPANVAKLVLVGAAGLDESLWVPSKLAGIVAKAAFGPPQKIDVGVDSSSNLVPLRSLAKARKASLLSAILARLSFITTTPSYQVPADIVERLRDARASVTLVTAGLDVLHRPHLDVWRKIPGVKIFHKPFWDHSTLCVSIAALELWRWPEIWCDTPHSKL